MAQRKILAAYLPPLWVAALERLPAAQWAQVQELRLRRDQPVTLSTAAGERYLHGQGLTSAVQEGVYRCDANALQECFARFCQHAVYAHEWELQQGYLSVAGGIRVGVAGTAVVRDGRVCSVQQVTALCIRIPRRLAGCSAPLRGLVMGDGYPHSTLVVGPPSAGKTTLLRDLAVGLSSRGVRVAVVDERGELAGADGLGGCDVLLGYPKAVGVRQAIRCLAPDVVIFDELGDGDEVQAVADCAHAGVAVVASLHGRDRRRLLSQPLPRRLMEMGTFDRWVFLEGRHRPGEIREWYGGGAGDGDIRGTSVDCVGGDGSGSVGGPSSAQPCGVSGSDRPPIAGAGAADRLYCRPYERGVASAGDLVGLSEYALAP